MEFKVRDLKGHCVPIGPNFDRAKRIDIDFSGSRVSMKLNKHAPVTGYEKELKPALSYDVFSPSGYESANDSSLSYRDVMHRVWRFRGPLLTGYVAQLGLVVLLQRVKPSHEDFSLFNPLHLQAQVLAVLTEEYGRDIRNGRSENKAPVDWRPHYNLVMPALSYLILPNFVGTRSKEFVVPLAHEAFLRFSFHIHQLMDGNLEKLDTAISPQPLLDLADKIIESVQVELSPSARNDLEAVRAKHPDAKLSEHLEPLKWTTSEQDAEWDAYRREQEELEKLSTPVKTKSA